MPTSPHPPPLNRPRTRRAPLSQRSDISPRTVEQRAVSTGHTPRLSARTLPCAVAPSTRAHPSRAHPYMTISHRRGRATYLACVVRHTSTSSVGWIAAPVVPVAAAERGGVQKVVCKVSALAPGSRGVGWRWVCATSFTESGRVQYTATVLTPALLHCRGGRTDAGGGRA